MSDGRKTEKKAAKKSKCGIFSCLFPWMRRRKARSQSPLVENAEEHNHHVTADNVTENILNSSPKRSTPPTTDSHIGSFKLMKFGSVDVSNFGCFRRNDLGKPIRYSSLPILPGSSTNKVVLGERSKSIDMTDSHIGSFKLMKFGSVDVSDFGCFRRNDLGKPIRYSSLPILPGSSTNKVVLGERCKSTDMTGSYVNYIRSCKLHRFGNYDVSDFGCIRRKQHIKPILNELQHNFEVELQSILLSDGSSDGLSVIMECDEDIDLEDSSSVVIPLHNQNHIYNSIVATIKYI